MVAATDTTVLLPGETGMGKELIARTIHDLSDRKDNVMVKINLYLPSRSYFRAFRHASQPLNSQA